VKLIYFLLLTPLGIWGLASRMRSMEASLSYHT
jgi:hypothetical protein